MKTVGTFTIILASILLFFSVIPLRYAQGREIEKKIDQLNQDIKAIESQIKLIKMFKQKIDSGKYYFIYDENGSLELVRKDDYPKVTDEPWKVYAKIDKAKKITKIEYNNLLNIFSQKTSELSKKKEELAKLEKEFNQRHQEGHAFVEVKINQEKFSRPRKNLVRWDWQIRFDEINGMGVTIKKGLAKGYRGGKQQLNKVDPLNIRIEPYGSALLSDPYMQFSTVHNKTGPGKMKFIYSGIDDNGNEVKAEFEITRYPK
jgi:hypothetical protein